jgi:hypothetical protein
MFYEQNVLDLVVASGGEDGFLNLSNSQTG